MKRMGNENLIPRHRRQAWLDEGRMHREEQDYPRVTHPEPCVCGSELNAIHFLDPDADPVCIVCYYEQLGETTP